MSVILKIVMLAVLSGLAVTAVSSAAEPGSVYRWVDAQGAVHFSDQPHGNSSPIEGLRSGNAAGRAAPDSPPVDAEKCATLRQQLATYEKASHITEVDALGNSRTFTREQQEQLVTRTQAQVKEACGTPP